MKLHRTSLIALSLLIWLPSQAFAQAQAQEATDAQAEQINVDAIKEKYWARGDESELGVVQNRLYSKENKFEIGAFTGFVSNDPFLSITSLGGSVGYHFTETLGLHIIGWKPRVGPSAAFKGFQQVIQDTGGVPAVPSTNEPRYYAGAEGSASILYGKLSLVGKAIIYYDFHLLGAVGVTGTESGRSITPSAGLGQKVFLSKHAAFRVDYRAMRYKETLLKKQASADLAAPPTIGQPIGDRINWTHSITLGFEFLFGGGQQ